MSLLASWFEGALLLRPLAGNSARRRTYFLLLRQKKVGKEKATPLSVSLRFATGNLRCSEKAGVRRTRCTSFRSDSCGPYPAFPCAPRHSQRGLGLTRRGASLCGECACVGPGPFTEAERSDGPTHPLWLRRGAQRFADKGSQLFERNAVERVLRDPAKREHRRLPVAKRRVADSGVAFSLPTFFWRSKRK